MSIDVLPLDIRKEFAENIGVTNNDELVNWGEKKYNELNQSKQTTEKQSSGNKLPEQDLSVLNDAKTQLDNALKTINAKDLDKAKGGVGISAMYFARKFVKTPDTNKPLYDAIYNYYFDTVSNYQLPEQAKQPWEMTKDEFEENEQKTWWLHSKVESYDENSGTSTVRYYKNKLYSDGEREIILS